MEVKRMNYATIKELCTCLKDCINKMQFETDKDLYDLHKMNFDTIKQELTTELNKMEDKK